MSKADRLLEKQCEKAFVEAGLVEVGKVGGTKILGRAKPDLEKSAEPMSTRESMERLDATPETEEPGDGPQLRTQEDRWREHIGKRIVETYVELDKLNDALGDKEQELSDVKADVSDLKAEISGINAKLKSYTAQMRDIQAGTFSPPLFDKHTGEILARPSKSLQDASTAATSADPGETAGFEALGLSEAFRTKLEESQLAKEVKLKTVADLERAIAADQWWHRKIKGVGKQKIDDLMDAIVDYRATHPKPLADDGRRKQCNLPECRQHYTHGLFVPSFVEGDPDECPKCGNTQFWQLVDPKTLEEPEQSGDDAE